MPDRSTQYLAWGPRLDMRDHIFATGEAGQHHQKQPSHPLKALQWIGNDRGLIRNEIELIQIPSLRSRHVTHDARDLPIQRHSVQDVEQPGSIRFETLNPVANIVGGQGSLVILETGVDEEIGIVVRRNCSPPLANIHHDPTTIAGFGQIGVDHTGQSIPLGSARVKAARNIEYPGDPMVRLDILDAHRNRDDFLA
ncbi:MAG: hypothetical protein QM589_01720 [Thermomicrobiales bacterium]